MRHETDNVNGDALLWESYFPSLVRGTTRASSDSDKNELPNVIMSEDKHLHFTDRASISTWYMTVSNSLAANKKNVVVGLDLECSVYDGTS